MNVGDDVLKFGYDASGSPMYLQFNNSRYFYATNVQGDVTALVHTSGTAVVEYTYDAWGNILTTTGSMASTVGAINPLRYRGYVYDAETGLYYLQSRYYDPVVGRFLNADALVSTGQGIIGNNMFVYCGNNPVLYQDATGTTYTDIFAVCYGEDILRDITDMLNTAMYVHAEELYIVYQTFGYVGAAVHFKEKVRTGGEWDLKNNPEWKLNEGEKYIYNGQIISFDAPW